MHIITEVDTDTGALIATKSAKPSGERCSLG